MDWKSLLERYLRAVIHNDHIVGLRSAQDIDGSDAEKATIVEMATRIWRNEGVPDEPY